MSYFNHPLFQILLDTLGPIQASSLQSFIGSDDVLGLVTQSVDRHQPLDFDDVFFKELFRKVSDADLGIDTAQVAISGFLGTEISSAESNQRIRNLRSFIEENPGAPLSLIIKQIKHQIKIILGDAPSFLEPKITSGATVDLPRNATVFQRLKRPSVSQHALNFLRETGHIRSDYNMCHYPIGENPPSPFGANKDDFVIYDYAALTTVGKNAKTDRVIVKGQTVNTAYQCSIGMSIKSRLAIFGLDINTAAEKHKVLACQASIDGLLATEDLKAASDLIGYEVVRLFLPDDWFILCNSLRATHVMIGDSLHKLEMFSPAGNGFTFELETLIFYACSLVTSKVTYLSAPPDISVFGDDIILPVPFISSLESLFKVLGFVINTDKSFSTGFFRESCGGDFYKGKNVRGYNAKALPRTPRDWISFTNAIRRVCYYNNSNHWRDDRYLNLWTRLIQLIPEDHRLYGPRHYGDVCVNTEDADLYTIKHHRWNGESIKLYTPRGGKFISADRAIIDGQLSPSLAGRACTHQSLTGHGYYVKQDESGAFMYQDGIFYRDSLLVSTIGISYKNQWYPYTYYGQAPEDLDELAEHMCTAESDFFRNPQKVPRLYQAKLLIAQRELLDYLRIIRDGKAVIEVKHITSFLDFTF